MKKILMIGLFLVIMLAFGVSATKSVTLSPISPITEKPSVDFQITNFRITNTGDENLTLDIELAGLSDFNVNFVNSNTHAVINNDLFIETGLYVDVTINGTVYKKVETTRTGTQDGTTFSGTISVKSGSDTLGSTGLNIVAESALDFKKIKSDGNTLDFDEKIDEIKPGDIVKFIGDIENLYSDADDEDIDLEDVKITITIESIDDEGDEDLEEEEDAGDIDPEKDESFSIEFEIPEDVEAEEYDVIIIVEGDDSEGATHFIEWKLVTLEVEKDRHDIWITKASVSPSKVSCSRDIKVNVELKNQGTDEEDEVVLRIENSALDIDYEDTSIPEIDEGAYDEDTEYDKAYPFEIGDKVKAGTYPIKITVYYETDEHSDDQTIDLKVEKCEDEEEPEEDEEETVVIVSSPSDDEEDEEGLEILTSDVTETIEGVQSSTYMTLLIAGISIAVIVVIIMVVVLLSLKKRKEQI